MMRSKRRTHFPTTIVPIHCDGWAHFTQSGEDLEHSFKALGIGSRMQLLKPRAPATVAPSRAEQHAAM
jgi:hypothetical protein